MCLDSVAVFGHADPRGGLSAAESEWPGREARTPAARQP